MRCLAAWIFSFSFYFFGGEAFSGKGRIGEGGREIASAGGVSFYGWALGEARWNGVGGGVRPWCGGEGFGGEMREEEREMC